MEVATQSSSKQPVQCPICGNNSWSYARHPEAELYRCQSCGHCFSAIGLKERLEAYEPDYFELTHRNWFQNPNCALFELIAKLISSDSTIRSVIDVGCGRGDFLRYLKTRNQRGVSLTGIDLSSNPPEAGIEYIVGDVLTTSLRRDFDMVVSLAVIEHMTDVHTFSSRLHDLCRPTGRVVVMTLNEQSVLYRIARILRYMGFPLPFNRLYSRHHIHHFTRRSLAALLESHGLEIETTIMHNAPLAAIDIPVSSPVGALLLRMSVGAMFTIGRLTSMTYLQTLLCRRPRD